jgi:DNA-binding Lrp family transcriptional regulator
LPSGFGERAGRTGLCRAGFVPATVAAVDATDFAIYRHMSPDGAARFWGGRRVFEPRIGAREIAAKVGLSETAVRTRLKALRGRGYLADSAVWPNPSLFGVMLHVVEVPVPEVGASRAMLDDLALVEGVTFARDVLDEHDRKLQVYFVADGPAAIARRAQLVRRLAQGAEIRGPRPYYVPEATRELSRLDWRVVGAVRAAPADTLQQLTDRLGTSLKTTGNRYRALLDHRAVWWTHGPTSTELPLAFLTATVAPGNDPDPISGTIARAWGDWMPVAADGRGRDPAEPRADFAGLLLAESPVAVEAAAQRLLDLDGIASVRRTFALGSRMYPAWFDDQVARRIGAA